VTMLERELVDAASIVALTVAVLFVGRRGPDAAPRASLDATPGRRSRSRLVLVLAFGAVVVVATVGAVAVFAPRGGGAPSRPAGAALPDELTGAAPWPANTGGLRARLAALGLPALGREGTAVHIHQHLDVFVHGRRVQVPAGIGIAAAQGFISPIHTHDTSGIVHVESPQIRTFTLGQFFGVWGVRVTRRCLGGYCAHGVERLRVYADGRAFTGDPSVLPLAPHTEIVVAFGTGAQLPRPLPSAYTFPPGL
jgi:hypothetical protein